MASKFDESDWTAINVIVTGLLLIVGGYLAWGWGGLLFGAGLWTNSATICRTMGTIRRKL